MSAVATHPFPCPQAGCNYRMDTAGSIPAHLAMAHPEVPMDVIAPKRSARNVTPSTAVASTIDASLEEIPLELVDVGDNVRVTLEAIDELAASIAEHGVLQPVKATLLPGGRYRLLWGQRRVLAARKAGLVTIPALVSRGADIVDRPIEQLVENLHRADLNPIDRAEAMRKVVDAGVSLADLARKLGIAPSTVANDLRLLTLDERVTEQIRAGELSASHGKAMASLPPKQQLELAERVAKTKLSTKDLERELEWKRQTADNEADTAKRTARTIPKLVPALEAAKVAKGDEISLGFNSYSFDVDAIVGTLRAAGYTKVARSAYRPDRPGGKGICDCTAVKLAAVGVVIRVVPVCSNEKHHDRARNFDREAEDARKAAIGEKVAELRGRIRVALEDVSIPILILAAHESYDLAALIAKADQSDDSRGQLRDLVAQRLALVADSRQEWDHGRRAARDGALDAMLVLFPVETEG